MQTTEVVLQSRRGLVGWLSHCCHSYCKLYKYTFWCDRLLTSLRALSVKANMISAITGIPPEKLQVFHHWTSYAMFVLALIHTFPFIIFHIQKGDMVKEWKTNIVYWTGIPALLSQTYLTVMSLPSIRYD